MTDTEMMLQYVHLCLDLNKIDSQMNSRALIGFFAILIKSADQPNVARDEFLAMLDEIETEDAAATH